MVKKLYTQKFVKACHDLRELADLIESNGNVVDVINFISRFYDSFGRKYDLWQSLSSNRLVTEQQCLTLIFKLKHYARLSFEDEGATKLAQYKVHIFLWVKAVEILDECLVHLLSQNLVWAYSIFLSMLNFLCILKIILVYSKVRFYYINWLI